MLFWFVDGLVDRIDLFLLWLFNVGFEKMFWFVLLVLFEML